MAPQWQPGEQYNYGDVVEFEGVQYKIIQPHRSQGDWLPPITPALWGRLQGGYCDDKRGDYKPPPGQASDYGQQQYQATNDTYQPQQEEKKHWYDIDEKHKKELEIGGGILAGAAAIGAGIFAYKHHEDKKEQARFIISQAAAHAWSANTWIEQAQVRTQQWRAGQYKGPVAWIWNEGKDIPRDAIQGGEERGGALYICRAYHDGGIFVGKACSVFKKGAVIGYKKDEVHIDKYEILVGDSRAVKWVPCFGQFDLERLGARPVEGGKEPDGNPIYIAQAPYHGAVHPGKACETYGDGCYIPYDDTEKKVKEYAVLCYA